MKQFLLITLIFIFYFFFSSFPSLAKWEKFSEGNFFTEYFELESIKKIDNIVFVWSMYDYKKPQKKGNLSTKYYSKYDCKEKRYQVISIINYKTNMGRGRDFTYTKNISIESQNEEWIYPKLNSINYHRIQFICGI